MKSSKWNIYITPVPPKESQGSLQNKGQQYCRSQRCWVFTTKWCLLTQQDSYKYEIIIVVTVGRRPAQTQPRQNPSL